LGDRSGPPAAGKAPAPAPGRAPLALAENPLEGTFSLSEALQVRAATAAATPFTSKAEPAATAGISAAALPDILPQPPPPSWSPSQTAAEAAWIRGPGDPTPPPMPRAPEAVAAPPPPAAPGISSDEIAAWPPGLGAEFLVAMAEAADLG
jgi:hypothetical protein